MKRVKKSKSNPSGYGTNTHISKKSRYLNKVLRAQNRRFGARGK